MIERRNGGHRHRLRERRAEVGGFHEPDNVRQSRAFELAPGNVNGAGERIDRQRRALGHAAGGGESFPDVAGHIGQVEDVDDTVTVCISGGVEIGVTAAPAEAGLDDVEIGGVHDPIIGDVGVRDCAEISRAPPCCAAISGVSEEDLPLLRVTAARKGGVGNVNPAAGEALAFGAAAVFRHIQHAGFRIRPWYIHGHPLLVEKACA